MKKVKKKSLRTTQANSDRTMYEFVRDKWKFRVVHMLWKK